MKPGVWRRARYQVWRGVCGKTAFSSWRRADRVAGQLPEPGRVYFGACCGGYHVTRFAAGEWERRRSLAGGQA